MDRRVGFFMLKIRQQIGVKKSTTDNYLHNNVLLFIYNRCKQVLADQYGKINFVLNLPDLLSASNYQITCFLLKTCYIIIVSVLFTPELPANLSNCLANID